jgi:CDP-paratose 2-epimerase
MFDKVVENIEKVKGEVFNIGGGRNNSISILELLEVLRNELNISPSEVAYDDWRRADQKVYISDTSKANKILGWSPKVSAVDGIKNVAKWINEVEEE